MDTAYAGGQVTEVKEHVDVNGIPVGVVAGHIAAFSIDQGDFLVEVTNSTKAHF